MKLTFGPRFAESPGKSAALPGNGRRTESVQRRSLRIDPRAARWGIPGVVLLALGLLVLSPGTAVPSERPGGSSPEATGEAGEPHEASPVVESEHLDLASPPIDPVDLGAVPAAIDPAALDGDSAASQPTRAWPRLEASAAGETTLDCMIEPWEVVEVGSPVTGLIAEIPVERSDAVEVGQVVVVLESGVERAAVELARMRAQLDGAIKSSSASLELSENRKARAQKLFDRDALSLDLREELQTEARLAQLELEKAREARQLASLELDQAEAVLRRRTLRSPIAGVVIEREMAAGEVVDEETILKIAQIDPLRVEVILPAARFGSVSKGMRAAIAPELGSDDVHVGTVVVVDPVIDPASGTFAARLQLPNPDRAIPSGLHCQARFLSD
jgi:RND family efflux transporter MFP subunit